MSFKPKFKTSKLLSNDSIKKQTKIAETIWVNREPRDQKLHLLGFPTFTQRKIEPLQAIRHDARKHV